MCIETKKETGLKTGTVTINEMVGTDLWRLSLKVEGWQGPAPAPGQFIMLRVTDGQDPLLARPFGVAGFAKEGASAHLEIIYRVVGRGTGIMASLVVGVELAFLGPLGNGFRMPPKGSHSILVAGGVGLPPLLYLARRMVEEGRGKELTLLYGETTRERLLDLDHRIIPAIDVAVCTDDGTCGTRGLVTDILANHLNGKEQNLYVCGPNAMMAAVHDLAAAHRDSSQYSLEANMACGFGVCSGCAVMIADGQYVRVCVEGPVFNGDQLSDKSFN